MRIQVGIYSRPVWHIWKGKWGFLPPCPVNERTSGDYCRLVLVCKLTLYYPVLIVFTKNVPLHYLVRNEWIGKRGSNPLSCAQIFFIKNSKTNFCFVSNAWMYQVGIIAALTHCESVLLFCSFCIDVIYMLT